MQLFDQAVIYFCDEFCFDLFTKELAYCPKPWLEKLFCPLKYEV